MHESQEPAGKIINQIKSHFNHLLLQLLPQRFKICWAGCGMQGKLEERYRMTKIYGIVLKMTGDYRMKNRKSHIANLMQRIPTITWPYWDKHFWVGWDGDTEPNLCGGMWDWRSPVRPFSSVTCYLYKQYAYIYLIRRFGVKYRCIFLRVVHYFVRARQNTNNK